ncbi:hypothetical protein BC941DRAFT_408182 [Chlamydoabsidia padenii]|nr:hypothetical protein BC941DRAFT_408182 [Chlamydoabsidia padenii]
MLNITPYIAKYVRSLHACHDRIPIPYSHTQFGVVLMVDVVGFSALTTLATEKGESGAEAIALEIGAYMGECIEIIESFNGDVVKFLGDAVLVCFQPDFADISIDQADEITSRHKHILVRRAMECGIQLLARQSHYRVYLTAEERSKHRSSTTGEIDRRTRNIFGQRFLLFDSGSSDSDNQQSNSSTSSIPLDSLQKPDIFDSNQEYSMAFDIWDCIPFIKNRRRRMHDRRTSVSSDGSSGINSIDLELHIALSCGDISNIVLGDMNDNKDDTIKININGKDINDDINTTINNIDANGFLKQPRSRPSSHSQHEDDASPLNNRLSMTSYISTDGNEPDEQEPLPYNGRLEYAICGPAVEALEAALSIAKAGEMCITPNAFALIKHHHHIPYSYEKRKQFYIMRGTISHNTAHLGGPTLSKKSAKRPYQHLHNPISSVIRPPINTARTINNNYYDDRPLLKQQTQQSPIEPLVNRTRSGGPIMFNSDDGSNTNPIYLKYINRSALCRLQQGVDNSFPAQFRDVTIMFVSLGKLNPASPEGLQKAQQAANLCIKTLVKYEGTLQQFAVDDKGATLLGVFGLPPLSHEREAIFAAKAAIELRDAYLPFLPDFSIALSTGTIFNSVLPQGCPYRRDPAIAGDTIILAVRMLKFAFAIRNIVCDFATRQQIGVLCDYEDYGGNMVKGKIKPIMIYGIRKFGVGKTKRISLQGGDKNSDFIGYKLEMERANRFLDDWSEGNDHHILIISGPSGVGKSFFCHALNKTMTSYGFTCCWSSSTEVERSSKYYLVKHLLLSLFDIIDSDKVPQNTKKRTSPFNHYGSTSSPQFESSPSSSVSSLPYSNTNVTNNRLQRLTTYSSMTRSSYGAFSTQSPDAANEILELILRCLRKCGEDDGFLPLFKVVFGSLGGTEENRYTRRLDGRGRDILLTGVITRMVKYVSENMPLVLILDDVQWADSASIRILQYIHTHCQHVLLLLASRPLKDYINVSTFIKTFCETGVSEEIALNGLDSHDIVDIILQILQAGVTRVSPEIVQVIQKRTGGNPLYVKNMAIVLKDFNHVTVLEGELVPSSNRFDPEDLLQNLDYKRIIKMQFDKLNPDFQNFLVIASCLDQYFTIYEVEAMITGTNLIFQDNDPHKIREVIEKYDVYHFLHQVDSNDGDNRYSDSNGSDNSNNVNGNNKNITNNTMVNPDEMYAFAHITIPKSIYDMVSYETRIALHRLLAIYYEGQLTKENYPELLGKVARHYLQTDNMEKQLYYLEALADLNIRSYLLPEATSNLESMVKILNENPNIAYRFGRIHQSDIYRRLGVCFTMRTQLSMGERYLLMALKCLGESWPKTAPKFLYKFWKQRFVQYRNRRWRLVWEFNNDNKKQTGHRVVEIMVQLSNIYFYTGKGRAFVYTCLVGLNACERLGEVGPNYTLFLARTSLLCWLNDQKEHSIFYITKALRHMDEKNDAGALTICAMLCFAAGRFKVATELSTRSIDAVKTLGVVTDCQAFYRSVGLVITMMIFEGTLDQSSDGAALLKQMADTAHSNGDYEAEIWLGVYHVANAIVVDRLVECEPFVVLLEHHLKQAVDYNRIAIHGTLLCYYSRCQKYDMSRRHMRHLVSILPSLTVTPNIFPVFGLIFATMGLYCMVDDEQVALVTTTDTKDYDEFILGIARLNHAFQQVKFWEFTQPCLYLARALPYISTGRTVEGYMVLRHGIYEMHFIHEIRFLKAYYWACMGKYAFTPRDRIDWTDRAKADFIKLGIPTLSYINPDPSNTYTNGTPTVE